MTRDDIFKRFEAAKAKKREYVAELETRMKEEYEKRTGLKANYFEVW